MAGDEELRERLAQLERRIEALEARLVSTEKETVVEEEYVAPVQQPLALIGRALIILGGAYLLRAITQATLLPELAGIGLALMYAFFWIHRGHRKQNLTYSCTGVFISFAVAWESCTRFHLIDATVAAGVVAVVAVGVLLIAARDNDRLLAWFVALGASSALIALAIGTRAIAPSAVAIVPVCIATVWAASRHDWIYLAFAPGVALDLMLIVLAGMTAIGKPTNARIAAAAIALFAMAATFSVYAWKRSSLMTFDGVQLMGVILIALTGTTVLLLPFAIARITAGVFVLALSIAAYSLRHPTFTVAAVIFALFGSALAMPWQIAPTVWVAAAVALAFFSFRRQAGAYGAAAFAISGLLVFSLGALFAPAQPSLFTPGVVPIVVFVGVVAAAMLARPPHLLLIALAAVGTAAMIIAVIVPLIGANPSRVAALRTILLAVTALAAGRFTSTRVLTNPVLILGGLKLLAEDFRVSSPATLFLSLAVYGSALVLASRAAAASKAPQLHLE
jgi:hypothetical protein